MEDEASISEQAGRNALQDEQIRDMTVAPFPYNTNPRANRPGLISELMTK